MISVIICTRNPRTDHLERTIAALKRQTVPAAQWELLIVDNGSDIPLSTHGVSDWHPRGRTVREEKTGVTHARLRAIAETSGDWLLFVDDDNVLADNYIQEAMRLANAHPDLGAFGAGVIAPEFDGPTPHLPWLVWQHLTVRRHPWRLKSHRLSSRVCPSGAGMIVRRDVARLYREKVRGGQLTLATVLQLVGVPLASPGANDFDLGFQSASLGLAMGVFPSLRLTHLMEAYRTEADYLLRLIRNNARAMALLDYVYHDGHLPRGRLPLRDSLLRVATAIMGRRFHYQVKQAWWHGQIDAQGLIAHHRDALEELRRTGSMATSTIPLNGHEDNSRQS